MVVAHAGGADAAERHVVLGHVQQGVVEAHAAGVGFVQHALLLALVIAEVVQGQRPRAVVDVGEGLVQALVGHDRQQRAEDLFLHQLHFVADVEHQAVRQAPALVTGEQRHQLRALGLGIGDVALEAAELALVDDGGVVRVVFQLGVEALHGGTVGGDEAFQAILRHQHIVRRHAGLPGVHGLAEGDALGGVCQRHIGGNDGRRLAAQLQGHRYQVLGGGAHHMLTDAGGAGE